MHQKRREAPAADVRLCKTLYCQIVSCIFRLDQVEKLNTEVTGIESTCMCVFLSRK